MTKSSAWASCLCLIVVFLAMPARSQPTPFRSIYGVVVTDKNEPVAGATVVAEYNSGRKEMVTPFSAEYGNFSGLGVVHIPPSCCPAFIRVQGGSFELLGRAPKTRNPRAT